MPIINPSLPSDGDDAIVEPYNTAIQAILGVMNGSIDSDNLAPLGVTTATIAALAVTGAKIANNTIDMTAKVLTWDGWISVTDTWTYATANTVTVPTDATTKYGVGDKVKITNASTTKYFYITAVSSTQLTLNAGTDYTVANSAISGIYYSKSATPQGFPSMFNYLPTLTGVSLGNGTLTARYKMVGKDTRFWILITFGSTTSVSGVLKFTPPLTPNSLYSTGSTTPGYNMIIGTTELKDDSTGSLSNGPLLIGVTLTSFELDLWSASGSFVSPVGIAASTPFTWAVNDSIGGSGFYEAA